jgi:tetratricopeptide (TPR) repeat protein
MNLTTSSLRTLLAAVLMLASESAVLAQNQEDISSAKDERDLTTCAAASTSADPAIEACSRILERIARLRAPALVHRGVAWKAKGDLDHAISEFAAAISADPASVSAYGERANVYRQRGQCDQAIADYDQVIRLLPERASTYVNRALCWTEKKQYDRALIDLDQAVTFDSNNSNGVAVISWMLKGRLHNFMGNGEQAIADYDEAIRLGPQRAFLFLERGTVRSRKVDYDGARMDYEQAIKLDPNNENGAGALAWSLKGDVNSLKGDLEQAIVAYDEAIRLDPKSATFYVNRGTLWRSRGEYTRATQDYDSAIALKPNDLLAYGNRGLARFLHADFAEATDDFAKVGRQSENAYITIWTYLSGARAGRKDAKKAMEQASATLKRTEWPYSIVEFFLGKRSLRAAQSAALGPKEQCEAQFYIGQWHLLRQEREDAKRAFQSAVNNCASNVAEHQGALEELKRLQS